jgi:hypothetical protein
MVHILLIPKFNLGHVPKRRGCHNLVATIQEVTEAELDVNSGSPVAAYRHFRCTRVVLPKVPVFVVNIHFHVEGIPDLVLAVPMAS